MILNRYERPFVAPILTLESRPYTATDDIQKRLFEMENSQNRYYIRGISRRDRRWIIKYDVWSKTA